MNSGRKMQQGLEIVSQISSMTMDLRIIMAKMTDRQKVLFTHLSQGRNELEVFVLTKRMDELAGKIPVVTTKMHRVIKTTSLRRLTDLETLEPESYGALKKIAQDHLTASIGNSQYGSLLEDMRLLFQLLAPKALATVLEIMEEKKNSAQTRLHASLAILDRSGYRAKEVGHTTLPYNIQIQVPNNTIAQQPEISSTLSDD